MVSIIEPEIRAVDRHDINAILGRNTVGRLAFSRGGRIDVIPINYVFWNGAIFGRTVAGGKLDHLGREGVQVTFQVDEIRQGMDWRSVLVYGGFHIVDPAEGQETWMRALGAVRRLQRHALRENDPFPERTQIFRILVDEMSGRAMG